MSKPRICKGVLDGMGLDAVHRIVLSRWRHKWGLSRDTSRKALVRRLIEESVGLLADKAKLGRKAK